MDRQIVFPGSIPLDTDILSIQRNAMVALGYLAQATLGAATLVDGLVCAPTAPASLTVSVGPGSIVAQSVIDSAPFGSLPAVNTAPLVKMGIVTGPTAFTLTRARQLRPVHQLPATGQPCRDGRHACRAALLQRRQPGPAIQRRAEQRRGAGHAAAATASNSSSSPRRRRTPARRLTPVVDTGWVGLYVITVNYGQTQITAANIAIYPGAPFIAFKLGGLTPGFSRIAAFTANGSFTVPNGSSVPQGPPLRWWRRRRRRRLPASVGRVAAPAAMPRARSWSSPGRPSPSRSAPPARGATGGNAAGSGGTSAFGAFLSATGGMGGASAASFAYGGAPGTGAGGVLNLMGGYGSDGNGNGVVLAGNGGASLFGGGGRAAATGSAAQQNGHRTRLRRRRLLRRHRQWRPRRGRHRHRGVLNMVVAFSPSAHRHPALARRLLHADPIRSSYSTGDGRAGTVVIACPSQDGTFTAAACAANKPGTVAYAAPATAAIATANSPVTVFAAGAVPTGCDFVNSGSAVLYLDFTTTALAGSRHLDPAAAGPGVPLPLPPLGAVSAVASQPQPFVAIRY